MATLGDDETVRVMVPTLTDQPVPSQKELEVWDAQFTSTSTDFQKPNFSLSGVHSAVLFASAANTENIHICFSRESARSRRFLVLAPGGSLSISVSGSDERFRATVWLKNATSTAEQLLYVFGLR